MSAVMEEDIKRWTARRKAALVLEIIQGKTTVAEASRSFDVPPSEIEEWVEDGKRGMENALRAKPLEIREEYERQLSELQAAYGEAMLELRARKKLQSLLGEDDK
jgi:transposase-like protein